MPIEHYLFCHPKPVPKDVKTSSRGVTPFCRNGVWHLLDVVGQCYYPNVADWIEETRRYGLSRRVPKNLDFSLLTPASRIIILHSRANIRNWPDFLKHDPELNWQCPRRIENHPKHDQWPEHWVEHGMEGQEHMCSGWWWHDVEGGEPRPDPFNVRYVVRPFPRDDKPPTFQYAASQPPLVEGKTIPRSYTLAGVGSFPCSRIVTVRDKGAAYEQARDRIAETCSLPFAEVDE
jgi:hypothetical protein